MKKVLLLFTFFNLLLNCSFDNKSGIWKDEQQIKTKKLEVKQKKI